MVPSQLIIVLTVLACAHAAYVYSSFWAPLLDRRLLNYRVDAAMEPGAGKAGRARYATDHGYKGERLIADLGTGRGPSAQAKDVKMYGDVKLYYT